MAILETLMLGKMGLSFASKKVQQKYKDSAVMDIAGQPHKVSVICSVESPIQFMMVNIDVLINGKRIYKGAYNRDRIVLLGMKTNKFTDEHLETMARGQKTASNYHFERPGFTQIIPFAGRQLVMTVVDIHSDYKTKKKLWNGDIDYSDPYITDENLLGEFLLLLDPLALDEGGDVEVGRIRIIDWRNGTADHKVT